MLPLTNALRSRICLTAPHLLVPPKSPYPTNSRFLAKRSSLAKYSGGNHQLLQRVTGGAKWSKWFRGVSVHHARFATTTGLPPADEKPTKAAGSAEKPFRRLLKLAKPERLVIGASVACLCVSSAVTMSVPYCIGKILDIIFTDSFLAEKLSTFCLAMVGVFVVGSAANFGRIYLMNGACKCRICIFWVNYHNY